MAKNQLHNLKKNRMTFETRGLVTGTKSKSFYRSGTTTAGRAWNEINFGLTYAPQKTIYMKISGFEQDEVFFFERVKKGETGSTKRVAWKDRKKDQGENYRMSGINISVDKNLDGSNVNEMMVPYDAVEHLHTALQDGQSFYIKGDIVPSSYINREGNMTRKVDLVPTQMSFCQQPINFDTEGFTPKADIEIAPFVFSSIEKEMDENDKATGRFILQGYSIQYNAIETMNFIIEANDSTFANQIRKRMRVGSAMTMFGNIEVVHDIVEEEDDDDGWGTKRKSPMNKVKSKSHTEYVIYDAKSETFDAGAYDEDAIAAAIRNIKNAKKAEQNFGGTDIDTTDDEDDMDNPW